MTSDLKWFSDLPDCEDKDFNSIMITVLQENSQAGLIGISYLMVKMMICITRMKREIKKLRTQPVDSISSN